jgi:hypothetical protein
MLWLNHYRAITTIPARSGIGSCQGGHVGSNLSQQSQEVSMNFIETRRQRRLRILQEVIVNILVMMVFLLFVSSIQMLVGA